MKERALILLLAMLSVLSCGKEIPLQEQVVDSLSAEGATVYGKVECMGNPLAGVVVSDGVLTVRTDKGGVYRLKSSKKNGHVFISVPSGYRMAKASSVSAAFWTALKLGPEVAERVDFQLVKETGQENHTMLVMGDIHLYSSKSAAEFRSSVVPELAALVNEHTGGPLYGLTLGDMTWDWYWYANDFGIPSYLDEVARIPGLIIYNTVGNHDHDMNHDSLSEFRATGEDRTCQDSYRRYLGPTCYSFNIGQVHYISLDDVITTDTGGTTDKDSRGCMRGITDADMKWLKQDLSYISKDTPIVVSMHIPLFNAKGTHSTYEDSVNSGVADITAPFREYENVLFLCAHTHTMYSNHDMRVEDADGESWTVTEWNCGALCGNFWTTAIKTGLNICTSGAPGGYRLLNWNGRSMISIFKALGKPNSYAFRSYDRNKMNLPKGTYTSGMSGKSDDNVVLVNVWDYRPGWTVSIREGNTELPVTRTLSHDPLYLLMYSEGLSTTTPTRSVNIFSARASAPDSPLVITVKDEYGNTYVENMARPKDFTLEKYLSE